MLCGSAKGVEWGGRHQTIVFQVAVSHLEVCVQKGFARFASLSHTFSGLYLRFLSSTAGFYTRTRPLPVNLHPIGSSYFQTGSFPV